MSAVERPGVSGLPALPADVWAAIARATLRDEGDSVWAWRRLSLVHSTWRAGLQGAVISVLMGHDIARILHVCMQTARRIYIAQAVMTCLPKLVESHAVSDMTVLQVHRWWSRSRNG